MKIKDLISVVIPCYNGEKYLEKCFDSLLNQTYKKLEIIIIDDGSTDETNHIILNYKSKFEAKGYIFKNIYQENSGQAAAVNKGLKYATGEYLVWQDCDDYYENDALEALYNYLNENKDIDFVRGKSLFRDDNDLNKIIGEGNSRFPNERNIFDFYVFETDSYTFSGIFMVRMFFFDKCIKDREIDTFTAGQNWQLILPLAYNGKCGYLDKIVYNYRVRKDSHSHSVKRTSELLERCNAHKMILFTVLQKLHMPRKELKLYKRKIKNKYLKKKIRIVLSKIKHLGR